MATLTQNIKIDHLALTVIDGFAGGNIYTDPTTGRECPGSPSIIMNAIREAERLANEKRTKKFQIRDDYFFIEQDKEAFSSLELTLKLSEHGKRIGNSIHLFNDDFAAHSTRIIEFVTEKSRSGRAIFVLDQCGYDKVPFACIREIMRSIPNAEIILTFAADFLIDYLREGLTKSTIEEPCPSWTSMHWPPEPTNPIRVGGRSSSMNCIPKSNERPMPGSTPRFLFIRRILTAISGLFTFPDITGRGT